MADLGLSPSQPKRGEKKKTEAIAIINHNNRNIDPMFLNFTNNRPSNHHGLKCLTAVIKFALTGRQSEARQEAEEDKPRQRRPLPDRDQSDYLVTLYPFDKMMITVVMMTTLIILSCRSRSRDQSRSRAGSRASSIGSRVSRGSK